MQRPMLNITFNIILPSLFSELEREQDPAGVVQGVQSETLQPESG